MGNAPLPDSFGAWGLPASTGLDAYRTLRADPSRWLPIAVDIARSHGLDVSSPHVFATGTNLVAGFGETLKVVNVGAGATTWVNVAECESYAESPE